MEDTLKKHYRGLFRQHGYSTKSVQYPDKKTHFKRFQILTEIDNNLNSVIDVGSGLGFFLEFLISKKSNIRYLGVDYLGEFVEFTKNKYSSYRFAQFQVFDITKNSLPKNYDYILANGFFSNKRKDNKNFMLSSIRKMFNAARRGISFNAMSTYVDYKDENLYYVDPLVIFDYCKKNLTNRVTLRHDYLIRKGVSPYEYTIYLYK